jgi:hypothetical protein
VFCPSSGLYGIIGKIDVFDTSGGFMDYAFLNTQVNCGRCGAVGANGNMICGTCLGECTLCNAAGGCISGHLNADAVDAGGEIVHYDFSNTGTTWLATQAPTAGTGGSFTIVEDFMLATPY